VWWNFEKQVVNKTAGEWIFVKNDLTEPWIFLIGADGRIAERWDNVATREEIEPFLEELPSR
jgi:peroxiredoxin